jgi:hypothetical protein
VRNPRTRSHNRFAVYWLAALACPALTAALTKPPAAAQPAPPAMQPDTDPVAVAVRDASLRFGIPERWIYAVMRAESAGRVNATSRVGAMGLMQIMPATWRALSARYVLGSDAYVPRANIMGGAAYIREMYDRYGAPGFLAAYNAGPGRYENHLITGRPLPLETRSYVAKIAPAIGYGLAQALAPTRERALQQLRVATAAPIAVRWTQAPLFAEKSGRTNAALARSVQPSFEVTIEHPSTASHTPEKRSSNGIFASLSGPSL